MRVLLLFLLVLQGSAIAKPKWNALWTAMNQSTVKVTSGSCLGSILQYEGSGILFTAADKAYVLTSDHVVLHSNDGICHSVLNPDARLALRARLVSADWGTGLALLEVQGKLPYQPPLTLERALRFGPELFDSTSNLGYEYHRQVMGFPVNSHELKTDSFDQSDYDAQLSDGRAPWRFHPFAHVHLSQVHGEFGMSGGPEFSIYGVTGLLSAMMADWRSFSGNATIAIDLGDLVVWTRAQLTAPSANLARPLDSQLVGIERVCTADLTFALSSVGASNELGTEILVTPGGCPGAPLAYKDPHGAVDRMRALATGPIHATVPARLRSIGEFFGYLENESAESVASIRIERR